VVGVLYAAWMVTPDSVLQRTPLAQLFPDRHWVLVLPSMFCVTWATVALVYLGTSMASNPPPESIQTASLTRRPDDGVLVWHAGDASEAMFGTPKVG